MGVISLPLESRYDFVLVAFNVVPVKDSVLPGFLVPLSRHVTTLASGRLGTAILYAYRNLPVSGVLNLNLAIGRVPQSTAPQGYSHDCHALSDIRYLSKPLFTFDQGAGTYGNSFPVPRGRRMRSPNFPPAAAE